MLFVHSETPGPAVRPCGVWVLALQRTVKCVLVPKGPAPGTDVSRAPCVTAGLHPSQPRREQQGFQGRHLSSVQMRTGLSSHRKGRPRWSGCMRVSWGEASSRKPEVTSDGWRGRGIQARGAHLCPCVSFPQPWPYGCYCS